MTTQEIILESTAEAMYQASTLGQGYSHKGWNDCGMPAEIRDSFRYMAKVAIKHLQSKGARIIHQSVLEDGYDNDLYDPLIEVEL